MKDQSILYLMHSPWCSNKQRQELFAEQLSLDYNMTIRYRKPKKQSQKSNIKSFCYIPFDKIPIVKHLRFLNILNNFLAQQTFYSLDNYDFIWLTSETLYPTVNYLIGKKSKIVWDCMDEIQDTYYAKKLLKRANYIFCANDHKKEQLQSLEVNTRSDIKVISTALYAKSYFEVSKKTK